MKTMQSIFALAIVVTTYCVVRADEPPAQAQPAEKQIPEAKAAPQKSADAEPPRKLNDDEYYELFKSFADTIDQVERNYVKPVDRRELMEAAIKGVLAQLDPYSSYIAPEEFSGFKTAVESQFGGIGIQITVEDGQLKVLSPLVGTPAYRAGIQAGDRIVKIEGEPTKGFDIEEAIRRLKGEAGTTVTFTIVHALQSEEQTVTLKREVIHVDTVLGDKRKPNDKWDFMFDADRRIGYIRMTAFSRDTSGDLKKALDELVTGGMKGLILDLRFNPGGLLNSAVEVSDLFLPAGKIVSTKGRTTPEKAWDAKKEGTYEGFPMVVLVNRYSASASEIVAAALQDHDRALVIGERTWGKGSVQNVIELESGKSALKLTTASYQRPNGHNIHRFPEDDENDEWGVKPNDGYEIKLSDRDLGRLVQYRRNRDILAAKPRSAQAAAVNEDPPPSESKDTKGQEQSGKQDTDTGKPPSDNTKEKSPIDADAGKDAPKEDGEKTDVTKSDTAKSDEQKRPEFVDQQLRKAIEYLTSELARAP
jgi:carboxyl-terminal processing protease